jgi:methyltransferase
LASPAPPIIASPGLGLGRCWWLWSRLSDACLATLALLQAGRWWCMAALGENWNVRIVVVPGEGRRRTGPYRWIRHPNYLLVVLEFVFLPLLMGAFITPAVFSLANLLLLRQRIRLEEAAMAPCPASASSDVWSRVCGTRCHRDS